MEHKGMWKCCETLNCAEFDAIFWAQGTVVIFQVCCRGEYYAPLVKDIYGIISMLILLSISSGFCASKKYPLI